MKRKLLSLFLATLMVFSSVLPVFATEGEQASGTLETDEPNNTVTLTYDDLYIDDGKLVFAWDAFDKKEGDALDFGEGDTLVITANDGANLTLTKNYDGCTVAYGNGFVTAIGGTIKVSGAYVVPADGESVSYTTELVYATHLNEDYKGWDPNLTFRAQYAPVFAPGSSTCFTTFSLNDAIQIGDAELVGWAKAWAQAYADAKANANGEQATFWTPVSKTDYDALLAAGKNVRLVKAGDNAENAEAEAPVGAYSKTGYETDWAGFTYVLAADNADTTDVVEGLGRSRWYDGYDAISANRQGYFNSYVMKSNFNSNGSGYLTENDYRSSVGKNGNWTVSDFGEVTAHRWMETISVSGDTFGFDANAVGFETTGKTYTYPSAKSGLDFSKLSTDFIATLSADYYAIRIYSAALNENQTKQNHFADLCKFYALDLELLANIKANDMIADAADMLASYELGDKDVTADELNAKLAELKLPEQNAGDYADLYVTDGLLYRWDAYNKVAVDENGVATLVDLNGGEVGLTLADAKYSGAGQYIESESAFDFSAIMASYRNEDGSYKGNLEYELVLTQLSSAPASNKYPFPNLQLGPLGTDGYSGGSKYYGDSYGGMGHIYVGYMKASGHEETSFTLYYFKDTGKLAYQKWQDASKVESGKSYYVVDDSVTSNNGVLTTSYYNSQISAEDQAKLEAVTFKYHSNAKGVQVSTEDWATPRYFGNYLGEAYSVGGAITFHLEEGASVGSLDLQLYRDGSKIVQKGGATRTHSGIYYAAGKQSNPMATYYATKTEAEGAVGKTAFENTSFKDDNGTFILAGNRNASAGAEMLYGYHAFRVYTRTLTEAERMQNHFADLASYHRIDELEAYNALSDESKLALWAQFSAATLNAVATDGTSNTSFDDVTKEELDAAILAAKTFDEKQAALKVYNDMYVEGANVSWNAYHEEAATLTGTTTLMNAPTGATVSVTAGSSAAFGDGYLRLVNSSLKITNAYVKPASGTANYTTELVYASYYDADTARDQINDHFFPHYFKDIKENNVVVGQELVEQANWPAFGSKQYLNTFVTLGFTEAIRYGTEDSIQYLKDWSAAYAAASKNENGEQATFWTPISENDYNTFNPNGDNTNFRKVGGDTGIDPVGAYSRTGYEANWEGFAQVLGARKDFYAGYNYAVSNVAGMYNSYILKSDINANGGGWYAQYDYNGAFGAKGSWSSADFGEITTHTWLESIKVDGSSVLSKLTVGTQYADLTYKAEGVTGSKPQNLSADFQANNFNADYYAIRVYPFTLTAEQRAQNHFADLVGYVKIDAEVAKSYYELSEAGRAAVHALFTDTKLVADEKAETKAAIEAAIADKLTIERAFAELGAVAENFYKFNGYQVHLYGTPALRADFEFVDFSAMEGVTLKEVGVAFASKGGTPIEAIVFRDGAPTGETLINLEFSEADDMLEKDYLEAEWVYSAYVTITYQGIDFTMECDMSSEAFGESVSMYEISCHEALKDLETSKLVRSICEAE